MKTKVLLSTMVLAAALAGCSQDEWGVNSVDTSDLDNRRVVGDVVLSLSQPSTRVEVSEDGSKLQFSADDKMGAHLMDEFKGTYPITTLTDYVHTNYPFELADDGNWKTTGVLMEGNYFFTYPFDGCQQSRGAVTNTVPVDQNYGTKGDGYDYLQPYLDNQFFVGYKYLEAAEDCEDCDGVGVLTAHVVMEPVHAYPVFRFANYTSVDGLEIYKMSLRLKSENGSPRMFYNTVAVLPESKMFEADKNFVSEGDLWKTTVYNPNLDKGSVKDICSSQTLEYNVHFPGENGLVVNNTRDFKTSMIVPAGKYGPMEVILYTNLGVATFPILTPSTGEDYNVNEGTWNFTPGSAPQINIDFDIAALKKNKYTFTVQSTENLKEYLSYIKDAGTKQVVKLTTVGEEVEFDKEVYDLLVNEEKNNNLYIELNGTLVIAEDAPANAIDRIDYYKNGAKLINKGKQVINETPVGKFGFTTANVRIDNLNELTLNADMPLSVINNFGKLTVNKSSVYGLINLPTATATVTEELNVIDLFNMGTLNVNAGAKVNILSKWFNIDTVNNDGTITTWPLDFSNPKFMTVIDYTKLRPIYIDYWKGFAQKVEINNIYKAFIAASAEAVNYGVINNNKGAVIDSKGAIIRNEDLTYVTETIIPTHFGAYIIDKGWVPTTSEIAAVTSLVNYTGFDLETGINNSGNISNLSNFGMLTPQPGSGTSLVEMSAETVEQLSETHEAAKLYLQGELAFWGTGYINMTPNDGVQGSLQAAISDNTDNSGVEYEAKNQIVFVQRTKNSEVDYFDWTVNDEKGDAARYINTIWLYGANAVVATNLDLTGERKINLWVTDSKINVNKNVTLTMNTASITGNVNFPGMGTVKLTQDIYVKEGNLESTNTYFTADYPCWIIGFDQNSIRITKPANSNIKIDYKSFDYVGPWIVIE